MSALNKNSTRLLDTAFPDGGAYLVAGRYDASDDLVPFKEGPAGSFDLPDDADLYYCVASIAAGKSRTAVDRVWVLVIDDVGKEIDQWAFDVSFPLEPSYRVESSPGSFHYLFFIEGGMSPDEFRALRLAMRSNALWGDAHNTGAAAIYRLPQGIHSKSTYGGWKVRGDKWTGNTYLPETLWKALASAGAPRAPGRGSDADLIEDEDLLRALVELIPNEVADWDLFVNVGRAIWGASNGTAPDVFADWAAKFSGNDVDVTEARWDSYHDAVIGRYWLIRKARESDPAGVDAWLKKEAAAVFDDEPPPAAGAPDAKQLAYAVSVINRYGTRMRYNFDRGAWHWFDNNIWKPLPTKRKLAFELSMDTALRVPPGSAAILAAAFHDGVENFCRQSGTVHAREADFDCDGMLLGTPRGTVDLRSGVLRAAVASEMISKATAVAPSATVMCPRWLKFIGEITQGDLASAEYLQMHAGYCLTGSTLEQMFLFLFGPGGNGKSVYADTLMSVMGDYAVKPVGDLFIKKAHGVGHTSKLAMLAGARLCTVSEVPSGAQWDEGLLKDITGGGSMTAGFKHKDEFTFVPSFKLLALGNNQPTFPGGINPAIRRRFRMMEFGFVPRVVDKDLTEKLKAEWPGILRWAIEGCLKWQRTRLITPDKVTEVTDTFFDEQDLMGQWLRARVERRVGSTEDASDMFHDWINWRNEQGNHELFNTATAFGKEMDARGFMKGRTMTNRIYQDVRLKPKNVGVFDK